MPPALYVYWKYGRPSGDSKSCHGTGSNSEKQDTGQRCGNQDEEQILQENEHHNMNHGRSEEGASHQRETNPSEQSRSQSQEDAERGKDMANAPDRQNMHHEHHSSGRPMWATVTVGGMHCGAGCVLGDLVGEWLVFGTGAKINGADIWPCLLIDYGFALLFGIIFQYLSIAPMSGEWGVKTIFRAAKADIASLTAFEIGLFGWMVIFQVAIWDYNLAMNTWTYWWMMQVGLLQRCCLQGADSPNHYLRFRLACSSGSLQPSR